jgi:hypothetical protein
MKLLGAGVAYYVYFESLSSKAKRTTLVQTHRGAIVYIRIWGIVFAVDDSFSLFLDLNVVADF